MRPSELPFRPIAATIAVVLVAAVGHRLVERRDAQVRQAEILRDRDALVAEVRAPMSALSDEVERWTVELASRPFGEAQHGVLPSGAALVYVHVRAADARDAASVHTHAQLGVVDGLASCLVPRKVAAVWSYGDLVASSELLGPTFEASVRSSSDRLSLSAHATTLATHRDGHHATLKTALGRATHVVIAVDEEGSRFVRVSVRALSDGFESLRVRAEPSHALIHVAGRPTALGEQQAANCSVGLLATR